MVNLDEIKARMEKSIDSYKRELSKLRTGRASAALLEGITVDYYGAPTPVDQTSQVSVPEARQLTIKPYDKTILGDIEKAINAANIGLTPTNDGELIRLNVPALTEETRKELAKKVKGFAEDAKISVRNVRRDANDTIKKAEKAKEITEDDVKSYEEDVQKMTDNFIKQIDTIGSEKETDILSM